MSRYVWMASVALAALLPVCDAAAEESAVMLKEIEVVAPVWEWPASETVVLKDALDVPYSDAASYLRTVPGVTAGRFGGHGLEPVIRGQSRNQLNVVADDAYSFGGCPNRMDPPTAYANLADYERVTIVRGYGSVLNGPGATGGSIILERDKPLLGDAFGVQGRWQGGVESNGTVGYTNANVTGGDSKAYARAHASIRDGHNYEDGDGREVRSAFRDYSGGLQFGYTPDANAHAYLSYMENRIEDALFAGAGMDSPLSVGETFRAGYENQWQDGWLRKLDVSGYASLVEHEMDNFSLRAATGMRSKVDSTSDTFGVRVKSDLHLAGEQLSTALDVRRNNRDANRYQGASPSTVTNLQSVMWPDVTLDEVGLGVEQTRSLTPQDRLILGGRYDLVMVDYGRPDDVASVSSRSANDLYRQFYGETADTQVEHNLGALARLEHDLAAGLTAYTGISRAVRTADATERGMASFMGAGGSQSWVGNPDIAPEKHHQLDVGLQATADDWSLGGNLYVNRVDDFILRDRARGQAGILVTAPNATIYRNVDALLSGLELQGDWQVMPTVRLAADATYTYGTDLDSEQPLAQIPPLQGSLSALWQALDVLELGSRMRWAVTQTRVDTNSATGTALDPGKTSGYAVFDVHATVLQLEPLQLTLGINNLLDKTYANHLSRSNLSDPTMVQVNEAGRSFYLQASLPF